MSATAEKINPIVHAAQRLRAGMPELEYMRRAKEALRGRKFNNVPPAEQADVLFRTRLALASYLVATFGPIFPLQPELKEPWTPHAHLDASADPTKIEQWTRDKPNCNWGRPQSAIDVDTEKAHNKDGLGNWKAILAEFNGGTEPQTRRVRTPTGGLHYHVRAPLPKCDLRPGVEIPNYVVLPGSHVTANGKSVKATGFYKDDNNLPIIDLPFISKIISATSTANDNERGDNQPPASDIDTDAAIEQAIAMLKGYATSPVKRSKSGVQYMGPAIQGDHGDIWTVQVANEVGDLGISCELCFELMRDHFNDACIPPWPLDGQQSLRTKVESAYKSRQSPLGSKSAQADFENDGDDDTDAEMAERLKRTAERRKRREQQAEPETVESLLAGWCYIGQQKRWVRKRDGMFWETVAFNDYFSNVYCPDKPNGMSIGKYLISREQGHHFAAQKFDTFCYMPGKGENVGGAYNQYVPSAIVPLEGDTTIWDEHLKYLFPVESVRKVVLDWLAWVLQYLDKKPKHALFILGRTQGTGKSWIGDVFAELIGEHNRSPVDQATFETPHNGWQMRTKVVTCEEVRSLSAQAMRKLHGWITQGRLHINEKNMPQVIIPDVLAYIFFSNKLDAIALDDTDRRYAVAETNVKPKDKAYYCQLYDLLDDPAALAAIKHQLLSRKLGDYTAAGAAPFTDAKAAMIEESASDLQSFMVSQQATPPFNYSLVTLTEIIDAIPKQYWPRGGKLLSPIKDVLRRRYSGIALPNAIQTGERKSEQNRVWAIGPQAMETAKLSWSDLSAVYRAEHNREKEHAAADATDDFAGG